MINRRFLPVAAILIGVLTLVLLSGAAASDVLAFIPGPGDDGETEFVGTITEIDGDSWQIGDWAVMVTVSTEVEGTIGVGDEVKVEALAQDDGTLIACEISLWLGGEDTFGDGSDDDDMDDDGYDDDSDDDDMGDDSDDDDMDDDSSDDDDMDDSSDDDDSDDDDDDSDNS